MRRLYIDVKFGSDTSGDGSAAKPFKTISAVMPLIVHGDEIIVNDSYGNENAEHYFNEASTIRLEGLTNVTVRFLVSAGNLSSNTVWQPLSVDDSEATIYIENCSDIRIENATLMSMPNTSPGAINHTYAIRAVNSNVEIVNCHIHRNWEGVGTHGELFSFYTCNATISACGCDGMNNSYSDNCSVIAVDGNGSYSLFGNSVKNITSNNGLFRGLWIKPETRQITVDGHLVHNIESDLVAGAIGIDVQSDASTVDFLINGAQLSLVHTGIQVSDINQVAPNKRIKHATFYKCGCAVKVINSAVELYSMSIHGSGKTYTHEYPPGNVSTHVSYGIYADEYSNVHVLNTIFTNLGVLAHSQNRSNVTMEHLVWNNCAEFKTTATNGTVYAIQYIRRIDPQYEDINADPWGYFLVSDQSPCIDSGKKYGDLFLGLAPDIGALERSRKLKVNDLPALLARSVRYSDRVPLTNIDIEGMIVRGLDTYDPEVKAGREGSALRDMAVKPLTGLLTPYTTELEAIRSGLSFSDFENLSTDAADALASNVFVTRKTGDVATGVVRIYFEEPVVTTIPAEVEFISSQGLRFYTIQEVAITAEEMSLNFDNGLYYVDILTEAESIGAEYNIPSGSITKSSSPMPAGVTAILNPNDFAGGDNAETNTQLKDRIETAITVRDLVTKKGITYVIPEKFTFVKDIQPIGFRDPEMLRDEILGYHIGGKVDIYIQTSGLADDEKIIELAPEVIDMNVGSFGNVPVIRIDEIEVLDPLTLDSIGVTIPKNKWSISGVDPKTRFSIYESIQLTLHKSYVGSTIKLKYKWVPELRSLQDWVLNSDNRVVCADLYVKHMEPAFTSFHIAYYAPEAVDGISSLLRSFIYNLKNGVSLQASDIIDYCYSVGVTHVHTPFIIRVETHKVDGTIEIQESEDQVYLGRIAAYVPDEITAVYMGPDPREL